MKKYENNLDDIEGIDKKIAEIIMDVGACMGGNATVKNRKEKGIKTVKQTRSLKEFPKTGVGQLLKSLIQVQLDDFFFRRTIPGYQELIKQRSKLAEDSPEYIELCTEIARVEHNAYVAKYSK